MNPDFSVFNMCQLVEDFIHLQEEASSWRLIKFNKNCWQAGKSSNQFATLLSFIEKQTFFDMKVEKV